MKKKSKRDILVNNEVKKLTYAYAFLLSATSIFVVSLQSFTTRVLGNSISYAIYIIPFLYFIVDVILKEIGYRPARVAVNISTIVILVTSIIVDSLFGIEFSILKYFGITLAYFISQFLNLSIYYYMLDNYKTPLFFVVVNLIFCLLVNNMLYMLFSNSLVFTSNFWFSYTIVVVLQLLISIILALLLSFIEQGIDIGE